MRVRALLPVVGAIVALGTGPLHAGVGCDQTVGLMQHHPSATDGYVLYSPLTSTTTYLIDRTGQLVHSWNATLSPGNSMYLMENGDLLRTADPRSNATFSAGGDAGLIERYDWDGNLLWSYLYSNDDHRAHHDIAPLPNGNVLILAWEFRSGAEALAAGRDPALLDDGELWPEQIVEVEPVGATGGNIVWEWHAWDHLIQDFDPAQDNFGVVGDHPELIDINMVLDGRADWMHVNAIDYNAELDQIVINCPWFHEFWVIDHSTTTAEAAGHTGGNAGRGGDLLYRWGNPQTYRQGDESDRQLFGQHDVHWVDDGLPGAGRLMIFNNGPGRSPTEYTSIDEIVPPLEPGGTYAYTPGTAFGPATALESYTAGVPADFLARFLGSAQRLANGHLLICSGPFGDIFEVDGAGSTLWQYVNPIIMDVPLQQCDTIPGTGTPSQANFMYRATHYPSTYPAFDGRDLTPQGPLETYLSGPSCADGVLSSGEECDDGNTVLGDGCSMACTFEPPCDAGVCLDTDDNDIRDVVCEWGECFFVPAPFCQTTPKAVPADLGGPFGDCPPDGFANIHDRNLALACFSGTTDCQQINIDAGSGFGACPLDGFCNIHDANHALTAFAGTNTCMCGPAPEVDPVDVGEARIVVELRDERGDGAWIADVFIEGRDIELHGYQLEAVVSGGAAGQLTVADILIEPRRDAVFAERSDGFEAFNVANRAMLHGLEAVEGVAVANRAYLATYVLVPSADAAGRFVIDIAAAESDQTFLIAPDNGRIVVTSTMPAVVRLRDGDVPVRRAVIRGTVSRK